jgi:hypothetical protein
MMGSRGNRVLAVLVVMVIAVDTWAWSRSVASASLAPTAVLTVDTHHPGNMFDPGAVGLSIETSELETDHLSAVHDRLVRLMRLLGPSVLRIGGNSVDFSWWTSSGEPPPPWATSTVTPADLSVLRRLLTATGWRVLLGVDLGHFELTRAADEARYAREILGADLVGIEFGNEPNDYGSPKDNLRQPTYSVGEYLREAEAYRQAVNAAAPGVSVYGPALTQKSSWLIQMGATAHIFAELTQHYYPTSTCPGTPPAPVMPPSTAAGLLSPAVRRSEDVVLQVLAWAGAITGRPTRIGETNSASCGGSASASPVFASALWSLDWVLRAVSSGVRGLNFHGELGLCGPNTYSPICASIDDAGEVTAQPEYYGLLAASQLEGGRFVPTSLIAPDPLPNLTTWATLAPGGTVRIAIDNLATAGLAQPVSIQLSGYTATEESLVGPATEARSDIVLGTAPVTGKGRWRPKPARLSRVHGFIRVVVRSASAVIVTLRRERLRG